MKRYEIGDIKLIEGKHNTVFVQRRSIIDGQMYTMAIGNASAQAIYDWFKLRLQGTRTPLIQDVFPHFHAEEREFLLSGITPGEWERKIAVLEDEEPDEAKETE